MSIKLLCLLNLFVIIHGNNILTRCPSNTPTITYVKCPTTKPSSLHTEHIHYRVTEQSYSQPLLVHLEKPDTTPEESPNTTPVESSTMSPSPSPTYSYPVPSSVGNTTSILLIPTYSPSFRNVTSPQTTTSSPKKKNIVDEIGIILIPITPSISLLVAFILIWASSKSDR